MPWGREACHVADRTYDRGGQDGTHAEDLGEGGTASVHLGFDAHVQVRDLPVESAHVAQHLGGQPPAHAGRSTAPGPYGAQDARGPLGRELPGHSAGEEVPQEPVQAALSALVRSATRSPRLSESRRSTSDEASETTVASLSLREAAKAVARASTPSFLRALPAKLESTRTRAESFGGTSTTDSPAAANFPARCRPMPRAFSTA